MKERGEGIQGPLAFGSPLVSCFGMAFCVLAGDPPPEISAYIASLDAREQPERALDLTDFNDEADEERGGR